MIFVDRQRTLREPGRISASPTSLILHVPLAWMAALWWFDVFTAAGAAVFLAGTLLLCVPAFLRWPYGRLAVEADRITLTPVRLLGLPLNREVIIDPTDRDIRWSILRRSVSIAPRQGAPYVLVMKRPRCFPLWLACSVSPKYLERELASLTGGVARLDRA